MNATNFGGANIIWVFQVSGTRTAVALTASFPTHGTATAVIATGFSLSVSGAGVLSSWINAQANSTLTILNTRAYKLSNLNLNSTVIYGAGSGSVTSPRNAQSYGNLRLSTSLRLANTTGTQVAVAGQLILDAGVTLSLTSVPLVLTGQGTTMFSGTGVLFGGTSSVLRLSGGNGGNNGTLLMSASAPTLNTLSMQFSSASNVLSLGSSLTVRNGTFDMQTGDLDLNGNNLQIINAAVRLPATSASGEFLANPASAMHIRPTSFTNNQLFFNSGFSTLGSLTFSSTTLTMGIGSPLIILDSLAVNAGTLQSNSQVTVEANSGMRGRIARSNGSISGNVTVRNFISGGNSGWMLLGVDGVTGNNVSSWDTWYSSGQANGFPMTCDGCSYEPDLLNFQSIYGWSEAANDYDVNVTSSTALVPGVGFWVFVGDSKYTTSDLNVLNTGPANMASGSFVLSVTGSDPGHLNLLANPYASPISWRKLYAGRNNNNVDPVIYIYSPDVGGTGYRTFNATTLASTNGLTDIIPTGQGFYVSTSAAATMTYNQAVKMSDNTTNLSRTASDERSEQNFVTIKISGPSANDETMVFFDDLATATYDRMFDARKLFGTPPVPGKPKDYNPHGVIYTKDVVGMNYAINAIPPVNGTVTIPMSVRISQNGQHSISASEILNYDGGVLLKDKVKGVYHDLEQGAYSFNMNTNDNPDRFELIFYQRTSAQPLSITELNKEEKIIIAQNSNGVFVKTNFSNNSSKTTISAFNIVGQQIMDDVEVVGAVTETYLDLNARNQVVIIRVTSNGESRVKKIIMN